jgi:hypothetical protein
LVVAVVVVAGVVAFVSVFFFDGETTEPVRNTLSTEFVRTALLGRTPPID